MEASLFAHVLGSGRGSWLSSLQKQDLLAYLVWGCMFFAPLQLQSASYCCFFARGLLVESLTEQGLVHSFCSVSVATRLFVQHAPRDSMYLC